MHRAIESWRSFLDEVTSPPVLDDLLGRADDEKPAAPACASRYATDAPITPVPIGSAVARFMSAMAPAWRRQSCASRPRRRAQHATGSPRANTLAENGMRTRRGIGPPVGVIWVFSKVRFARASVLEESGFEPSVPLGAKRSIRNASIRERHRAAYRGGRKRYRRGRPSGSRRSDHSNTATASELQVRPEG
jgi:hypothetical protein